MKIITDRPSRLSLFLNNGMCAVDRHDTRGSAHAVQSGQSQE
ncbi:MAG: hypothetical protein ACU0DH_16470 [Paracoccus sp. (in: a-proteobacteria)]